MKTGSTGRRVAHAWRGAAVALALSSAPLAAQVAIDETRPLRADASVELSVVSHSLVIEGWDRAEIQVTGEYDDELERLEIGGDETDFRLEIERTDREGRFSRDETELRVRLPRGVRLSLGTVSGSVRVSGVQGTLTGNTVSGSAEAEGALASVSLNTVSGGATYRGDAPDVRLQSVSGGVVFEGEAESVRLQSVSGSVRMEGLAETVDATAVSGSIRITSSAPVASLEAESVSGGVSYAGGLAPGGTIEVQSHSGAVDLRLGADVNASFDLSTFSGSITSDLAGARDEVRSRGRVTPNESLAFVIGDGSGRVEASSFSGSIRIR